MAYSASTRASSSRLRAIVRPGGGSPPRELTYEPDTGRYEATVDLDRVADVILFGCLFWALAGQDLRLEAALSLITLVTALCVSHVRAEAERAVTLGATCLREVEQRGELWVVLQDPDGNELCLQ